MLASLVKSLLHNIGVVAVGFGVAFLGRGIDVLLGIGDFRSMLTGLAGFLPVGRRKRLIPLKQSIPTKAIELFRIGAQRNGDASAIRVAKRALSCLLRHPSV